MSAVSVAGLAGKVAAITGATSGSGLAIAKLFAAEGASVVLMARGEDRLKALEDSARRRTSPASSPTSAIPTACGQPSRPISERFGKLDILINNAGMQRPCPLEELGDHEIMAQVAHQPARPDLHLRGRRSRCCGRPAAATSSTPPQR